MSPETAKSGGRFRLCANVSLLRLCLVVTLVQFFFLLLVFTTLFVLALQDESSRVYWATAGIVLCLIPLPLTYSIGVVRRKSCYMLAHVTVMLMTLMILGVVAVFEWMLTLVSVLHTACSSDAWESGAMATSQLLGAVALGLGIAFLVHYKANTLLHNGYHFIENNEPGHRMSVSASGAPLLQISPSVMTGSMYSQRNGAPPTYRPTNV